MTPASKRGTRAAADPVDPPSTLPVRARRAALARRWCCFIRRPPAHPDDGWPILTPLQAPRYSTSNSVRLEARASARTASVERLG